MRVYSGVCDYDLHNLYRYTKELMIIDCVSDLHGHYPELEGGDLLIVAGDLTAADSLPEYYNFNGWLNAQRYKKKILIAGNHDKRLQELDIKPCDDFASCASYLCDSGTEFEGIKIWGSPWTKSFIGMNPHCKAFTLDTEEQLAEKWALIPDDTDILITHGPAFGILDENAYDQGCGSESLKEALVRIKPTLHVFGHIHEQGGLSCMCREMICVNASIMDQYYYPSNKPVRIEI